MTLKLSNRDWPMGASNASPRRPRVGSVSWAGLLSCYFWLDPVKQDTGAFFAQVLPFYDQGVAHFCGRFEEELYAGLARA
jgi:methyl acetate hydrolase